MPDTTPRPQQPQRARLAARWRNREPGPSDYDVVLSEPYRGDRGFSYAEGDPGFVESVRAALGGPYTHHHGHAQRYDVGLDPVWQRVGASPLFAAPPREVLINWNVPLGYHVDVTAPYLAVNAMVFFRHACRGGLTVFPERRLAVEPKDGWVLLFDGQREPHGVTPLIRGEDGWRATVVFYVPVPIDEEETT